MVRTITDISRESWSAGTCHSDCLEERLTAAMAGTDPQPALEKQTLQKRRNPCRDGCGFLLSFIHQRYPLSVIWQVPWPSHFGTVSVKRTTFG